MNNNDFPLKNDDLRLKNVDIYNKTVGMSGAYVYYGRSHLKGGQSESCSASLGVPGTQEPGRSINRFVIGNDVTQVCNYSDLSIASIYITLPIANGYMN